MPQHTYPKALFFLSLLLISAFAPARAASFGLSSGASTTNLNLVPREQVLNTARAAFNATIKRRVTAYGENVQPVADGKGGTISVDQIARAAMAKFEHELIDELEQLEGDGILSAGEVSESLSDLREYYLNNFMTALRALKDGSRPPPARAEASSLYAHYWATARYTVQERNAWWAWILLASFLVTAVILGWASKKTLDGIETRLRKQDDVLWADTFVSLNGPVYCLWFVVALALGMHWLWIPGIARGSVDTALLTALCIAGFWFLWSFSKPVGTLIAHLVKRTYDASIEDHFAVVVRRVLRVAVLLGAMLLMARLLAGSSISGLLTGLGIVGIGLALILRGTLENIVASFTIFGDKPFSVGDLLRYQDQWGRVEDIGFRSTRFRLFTGHLISIPNSKLLEESIENISARPWIRRRFRLSLEYNCSAAQVEEAINILKDILDDAENQSPDEPPRVYFEAFGEYDLKLFVQYCFGISDFWEAMEYDSNINLLIKQRFSEANINFAFPTETNILTTTDGGAEALTQRKAAPDPVSDSKSNRQATDPDSAERRPSGGASEQDNDGEGDGGDGGK